MKKMFRKLSDKQYEREVFKGLSTENKFLYELFWRKGLSEVAEEFLIMLWKHAENTVARSLDADIISGFVPKASSQNLLGFEIKKVPGPYKSMVFSYGCVIVQLISPQGYFQVYVYPGEDKHMPPTSDRIVEEAIYAKNIAALLPDVWVLLNENFRL
ncbi:MAG: hypothetical protein H8E32_00195 [Nitrospinae bacterium]|nr:hypothetical protein [Nitrospinota bacterium]